MTETQEFFKKHLVVISKCASTLGSREKRGSVSLVYFSKVLSYKSFFFILRKTGSLSKSFFSFSASSAFVKTLKNVIERLNYQLEQREREKNLAGCVQALKNIFIVEDKRVSLAGKGGQYYTT